jgi:hypothetical protein
MKVQRQERRVQRSGDRGGRDGIGRDGNDESLIDTATMDEVLDAIEAIDLGQGWEAIAPALMPLLPRRRPLPPMDPPLTRIVAPGVRIAYGVDIGPAFWYVAEKQLPEWGVTADELAERALANVRERANARSQFGLIHELVADVPTLAFQSREGWASTLLLLPDQLARVFGVQPRLILAPMRDVIFGLPLETDREFASWFLEELRAMDMNALDVPLLTFTGRELELDRRLPMPGRSRPH